MININAKIESMGFNLDDVSMSMSATLKKSVGNLAIAAREEWVRRAQARLKTARETYVSGLRQATSFKISERGEIMTFEISLVGRMPNNFEFGMPSFDMKSARPGWLGGSKAKTGEDGKKYITIPFRHSTSSGARLDYSGKAAKANLKTELKKVVREYGLQRMIKAATGQPLQGVVKRVPNLPKIGQIARIFSKASHHPLSGLARIQKTYRGATQGTLMTFRVMSENSASDKWIHPGLPGVKLLPEIEKWVDAELEPLLRTVLGTP